MRGPGGPAVANVRGKEGNTRGPGTGPWFVSGPDASPLRSEWAARSFASLLYHSRARGAIAQLEEHLHGMQGVQGSSPCSSTNPLLTHRPRLWLSGGGDCPG